MIWSCVIFEAGSSTLVTLKPQEVTAKQIAMSFFFLEI